MIEAMETLLVAWGAEVISPKLEVSIRSPLGTMGDDAPVGGTGGTRCLSSVECAVVLSRAATVIDGALRLLAKDEPLGLGSRGRVLRGLAEVRYGVQPRLQVADQARRLGISVRTYRTRVDELHLELQEALPDVVRQLAGAELATDAAAARAVRVARAREAERESRRADKQRRAAGRAHARALVASKLGAA